MLNKFLFFFLLFVTLWSCENAHRDITLAIKNVNIIDPLHKRTIPGQTILIKDSVIVDVVDSRNTELRIPDSLIIDGKNKYAISGFWNMHTHVCWKDNFNKTLFPVLLSYGITGIRDMGGDVDIMNWFKEQIRQDPASGPVIYGAGPLLDGMHPVHPEFSVAVNEENLDSVLTGLYNKKADFFKVYALLPKPIVKRISEWCTEKNFAFAGHISEYITPPEAAKLRQKSFEHLNRIEDLRHDTPALDSFIEAVKANGNWLCPTLIIYRRKVEIAEKADLYNPLYKILDDDLKEEWQQRKVYGEKAASEPQKLDQIRTTFSEQKALVRLFYQQRLPMLIGSDFGGMAFVYPGQGFHKEMELLSEIGFNNYDILKMATYNPAVYFDITDKHGTIGRGKLANIVILNENPAKNIRNTTKIDDVIRNGNKISKERPTIAKNIALLSQITYFSR